MKYKAHYPICLKKQSEYDEDWLNQQIENNPSILGLGNIELVDRERQQPDGIADFLFQDSDNMERRYVVEVQLGEADGDHIVRAINYWDIECKRYPGYDHCAVLVAENVVGRFQNVAAILNASMPFIFIQVQALKMGRDMTLVFTKVLDENRYKIIEQNRNDDTPQADANYWKKKTKGSIFGITKDIERFAKKCNRDLKLNYKKYYIGLKLKNRSFNFIKLRPQKYRMLLEVYVDQSNEIDKKLEKTSLDSLYSYKDLCYKVRLSVEDIGSYGKEITELIRHAYDSRIQ